MRPGLNTCPDWFKFIQVTRLAVTVSTVILLFGSYSAAHGDDYRFNLFSAFPNFYLGKASEQYGERIPGDAISKAVAETRPLLDQAVQAILLRVRVPILREGAQFAEELPLFETAQ